VRCGPADAIAVPQYENDAEVLIADISFDEDDTPAAKGTPCV